MYLFLSLLLRPGREEGVPDCPSTNGLIAQYDALPSDCHNRGYGKRKERSFSFFLPLFLLSLSFALSPSVPRIYLSLYISSSGKRGAEIESHNTKGRLTSKAQAQVDREKVGSQQGTESVLCKKEPQTNKCEKGKKRNRTNKTNMLKMTNFKKVDRQAVPGPGERRFSPPHSSSTALVPCQKHPFGNCKRCARGQQPTTTTATVGASGSGVTTSSARPVLARQAHCVLLLRMGRKPTVIGGSSCRSVLNKSSRLLTHTSSSSSSSFSTF